MAAPYVGNADFRGYLSYLAKQGDGQADMAVSGYNGLGYVNNQGGINTGLLNELNQAAPGSSTTDAQLQQQATDYLNNAYAQYNKLNSVSAGGGSAGTAQDKADEAAYWQDQIDQAGGQLGRIDTQRNTGLQNILGSYQTAYDTLQGQKSTAERDYGTSKQNTINDNVTARNQVDTNVRNTNNNTQRLLAARGAGSSSAASILAPYAAALQGNNQRQGVQNAYGKNMQALDTNWGDTLQKFDNSFGNLTTQRQQQENDLQSGLDTSKAQLLQQQADAAVSKQQALGAGYQTARAARQPYLEQITQLLDHIDSLGKNPTFTPQSVAYQAPTLASYDPGTASAPSSSNSSVAPGALSNLGAYYTLLGGKDKNKLALA